MDHTEDSELWTPYYGDNQPPSELPLYTPVKAYVTANFQAFVGLCEVSRRDFAFLADS
jgi:hypothetical protein